MWSIAIYHGQSPFKLAPLHSDPVLTREHITDIPAAFVADPFFTRKDQTWHMFFEIMNAETGQGEIGLATSTDGSAWTYQRVVLKETFHLSYPYVFSWQGAYYMMPETIRAGAIRLYKALDFPTGWHCVANLIPGEFADASIFRSHGLWWIFACDAPYQHDTLSLYFASELTGPWIQHPLNPLLRGDRSRARPAGRVLKQDGAIFRLAQDCIPQYGSSVRAFRILDLSTSSYAEVEHEHSPILRAGGRGWNASGMHHLDACRLPNGQWLACVDGAC